MTTFFKKLCNSGFMSDKTLWLILLLGLLVRIPQLGDPVLDTDSFRQGATASIARNYYERGFHLFHPEITGWGTVQEPGLWPNEFPLYPFLVAIFYIPFGEHVIIGRIFSVVFCLIGAVGLYAFVKRLDDTYTARFAALWYLIGPQLIYHGRCFHRFPFAIALMVWALALYVKWLQDRSWPAYIGMLICGSLAILMMPPLVTFILPALLIHTPLAGYPFWRNGYLWLAGFITFLPSFFWYSWAYDQPGAFSLKSAGRESFRNWTSLKYYTLWWKHELFRTIWNTLWNLTMGPIGATFAFIGIFLPKDRMARVPLFWVLLILIYYMIDVHPVGISVHYIYYLILLPALCWAAGRFTSYLWNALPQPINVGRLSARTVLVAILIFGTLFHWNFMFRSWYKTKNHFWPPIHAVREHTPPDAKIIVDLFDPSVIYYMHRMGLAKNPPDIDVESLKLWEDEGATHLVIMDQIHFYGQEQLRIYLKETANNTHLDDNHVRIYELRGKLKDNEIISE